MTAAWREVRRWWRLRRQDRAVRLWREQKIEPTTRRAVLRYRETLR